MYFRVHFLRAPSGHGLTQWLLGLEWTPELAVQWQKFYNDAAHGTYYGGAGQFYYQSLYPLPTYTDLKSDTCSKSDICSKPDMCSNSSGYQQKFNVFLVFLSFLIKYCTRSY
jgi:hypothetical protein